MLSYGKSVTQRDDLLANITVEQLHEMIRQPNESVKTLVERLRLVRTIDAKNYGVLKKQLPYLVCGIFNPPYRRTENFGYCEYFMLDIDHISDKSLNTNELKSKLIQDSRVVLCFISPSEDGLKVLFRLSEKCYDSGKYSLFYKCFAQAFSLQYDLEQIVDARTSDVSRACFLSFDEEVYFNPAADSVQIEDFVNFDNPFETGGLQYQFKKEEKKSESTEKPSKEPDSEAIAFIREKLNLKNKAVRRKPQIYVPEQLEQILENLLEYLKEAGIAVEEIVNINYGKKFKLAAGLSKAEINLFFGKKGFSVVKSPRQGTSDSLNELITAYIKAFIGDYILLRENIIENNITAKETQNTQENSEFCENTAPHAVKKQENDSFTLIRQQAQLLYTEKNYREALPLFQTLWESFPEKCDEWDGWRYAHCAQQVKDYDLSLGICRKVYLKYRDFKNIKGLYAWTIFYSEIKKEKIMDEATFFRAAEGILKLSEQKDNYSPYTITIFKILDYLNDKSIYPKDRILEWTQKLNPALLEEKPFAFKDKDGKEREIASKKEQYFMMRSRALLEKGEFDECINLCNEALQTVENLHYGNEIWFDWRIALCYEGMNRLDEALKKMLSLLAKKREWFIQKGIAAIYFKQENNEKALQYAVDSALNHGEVQKKVNLIKLLAEILFRMGKEEEAKLHLALVQAFKTQDMSDDVFYEKKLVNLWNSLKFNDKEQFTGTVKTILLNGKAGFVETDNHKSYYFRMNQVKGKINEGSRVTFYLEEGFDAKKNKKTMNAVKLQLLTS